MQKIAKISAKRMFCENDVLPKKISNKCIANASRYLTR